jgi:hypothetical protein
MCSASRSAAVSKAPAFLLASTLLALGGAGANIAARQVAPPAQPPDLSGIWGGRYQFSIAKAPAMTPAAEKIFKARRPEDDPIAQCKPPGVPRVMNMAFPIEIVQTPKVIYFLMEYDHMVRRVYMDQAHPKNLDPNWLGHSIGRWEGRTLVVDTVGLTDETWLDEQANPHSDQLRVVERFTRSEDGKSLAVEVVLEDPTMYPQPIRYSKSYPLRDDLQIMEWVCEFTSPL